MSWIRTIVEVCLRRNVDPGEERRLCRDHLFGALWVPLLVVIGVACATRHEAASPDGGERAGYGGKLCAPSQACAKRCKAGDPASCVRLGHALLRSAESGDDEARAAAFQLWGATCDAGFPEACAALSGAHRQRREFAQALAFGGKACALGSGGGCTELGKLAWLGTGVRRDPERARMLWEHACQDGDIEGCAYSLALEAGELRRRNESSQPVLDAYREGCFQKRGLFCVGWGLLSAPRSHQPSDPSSSGLNSSLYVSIRRPLKLYLLGCHQGHAEACRLGASLIQQHSQRSEHLSRAVSLLETGCGGRPGELNLESLMGEVTPTRRTASSRGATCYEAGAALETRYLDVADTARAQRYLDEACRAGLVMGCRTARPSAIH